MQLLSHLLFDTAETTTATASTGNTAFTFIFKAAIVLYMLYVAVLGKGKLLQNDFPKCSPKTYKLIMRLISLATALFVLANGILEYVGGYDVWAQVMWAIGLAGLIALLVLNIALTDRKALEEARKKEEEARRTSPKNDPLRAAFVFDDEEENAGEDSSPDSSDEDEKSPGDGSDDDTVNKE